jgi:photosystem II stability/assembly factor-like uncharacterized protein
MRVATVATALMLCTLAPLAAQRRPVPAPAARGVDSTLFSALEWRQIGPFRGGRSAAVTGVVGQPYVYYFGGTGGGVWKTTDGGMTWFPVSDSGLTSGSIGAIAVAASDPNVVFVGTGESPIRGNVSPGDGMYKSTDAGKTWVHLGLRETQQIAAVRIHPTNPDLVYVAALGHVWGPNPQRGVFRSKDGGKTWDRVLFKNDSTGAIDLAMDPTNPRILYAALWQVGRTPWALSSGGAGSGLWKSVDGGDTWREITRNTGLPKGVIGKIGVAVSPANPDRVWAVVEADSGGVYRSDDGGDTWTKLNEDRRLRQRAWYYTEIFADPKNADAVYVENTSLYRSVDGGRTYTAVDATPHGDNHDLWIDPENPLRMINANDGGATVTYNGGVTWSAVENQPTAQFYHVTATTDFPYKVCGAQQDNTTVCIASRVDGGGITRTDWYEVGGCESGYIASRPDNPDVSYAGCYGGYLDRHDRRTGQDRNIMAWPDNPMGWGAADLKYRFQWTFPIVLSPQNPRVLYASAQVLFKSTNEGQSWTAISPDLTRNDKTKQASSGGPITQDNTSIEYYDVIFTVAPSPRDSQVIWTGSDDGLIQVTRDGGAHWDNVTPAGLAPWSLVSLIEASRFDAGTAYAAVTRYKLDDPAPYIYKTTDFGKTWTKSVTGLPATDYIRVVREDPAHRGLLFAGGEFGVYVSFDDGANWQSLRLNLPVVPIHDLAVVHGDLVAATHGRSFWILDDVTPLEQLADSAARTGPFLYQPRDAHRLPGGGGGGGRRRDAVGSNPPGGAVFYYYLKAKPDSAQPVKLEVLDSAGAVIHAYSSAAKERADRLDAKPGMNRFVWDGRYPDAATFTGIIMWGGSVRGPSAPPGAYQVRFTAGAAPVVRSFRLLPDPRSTATAADLSAQFTLLLKIRDRLSDANRAVSSIRELKEQITGVTSRLGSVANAQPIRQRADSLTRSLSRVEEAIYQVKNRSSQDPLNFPIRLNNRIAALAGVVTGTDAKPTDQSYQVFDDLSAQLQVQLDRLKALLDTDVPAFNELVKGLNLPAVRVRERGAGPS